MPKLGCRATEKHRKNLSDAHKGIPNANKGKKRPEFSGENHPRWKGGSKEKEYTAAYSKEYRHRVGISKKYNSRLGLSHTKEYKKEHSKKYRDNNKDKIKLRRKKYRYLSKSAGELPLDRIQMVYEDNIKKYGTLTCYLCKKLIKFGDDSLEHKTPLSRGGMNEYNNLAIAHRSCNSKKYNKTYEEYMLYKAEV